MPKTVKERFEKYYTTNKGRAAHLLNNARKRAKERGLEFTLTYEWIFERLEVGKCEVTGLPFVIQINHGKGHRTNSFSPSIERVNPEGPYTPENCQVVCWIYNRAKGAFPLDDLMKMVQALLLPGGIDRKASAVSI